jgi:phosphoribosylformimino-5-aminoimidazole carboxamide ribotide isomerase
VAVAGWRDTSGVLAVDLAARVRDWGVPRIQYTDVVRDGTLHGPNLAALAEVARASGLRVTAAGGVASLDDLLRLAALEAEGVDEAIVGTALYEGRFSLAEAIAAAGGAAGR